MQGFPRRGKRASTVSSVSLSSCSDRSKPALLPSLSNQHKSVTPSICSIGKPGKGCSVSPTLIPPRTGGELQPPRREPRRGPRRGARREPRREPRRGHGRAAGGSQREKLVFARNKIVTDPLRHFSFFVLSVFFVLLCIQSLWL